MYSLMMRVGKKWVFTADLVWQIGVGLSYDKIFDAPRFRLDLPGLRFEFERLADGNDTEARTDVAASLKDLAAALEAEGLDVEKPKYPLQHQQWVSGGGVIKINKAESDALMDGYCHLVDDNGQKRLWPSLKTQKDIEEAWVTHAMESVNIVQILMTGADYDAYVNGAFTKERIILASEWK